MVHPAIRTWRRPRSRSPAGFPSIQRDRGFTLVELLVVVAIISILAGLIIPGMMILFHAR